jgi:hypothetical protein
MVETKGKATIVRKRFPNYHAPEGKENGKETIGKAIIIKKRFPIVRL